MTRESSSPQDQAARLLAALEPADQLSCDEAREQIPALIEAELAGVDVDNAPEFAALLKHLDACEECADFYASLAEDLAALTGDTEALPKVDLTPPPLLTAARTGQGVVVRVLNGLKRRFELALTIPPLVPEGPTLSGGKQANLFSDWLPEVAGTPLVSISLLAEGDVADLIVAVKDASPSNLWRVQVAIGAYTQAATTDENGIARFGNLHVTNLQDVLVSCSAVDE